MKFTKQQRIIIKKIASGDIKDIPSFGKNVVIMLRKRRCRCPKYYLLMNLRATLGEKNTNAY